MGWADVKRHFKRHPFQDSSAPISLLNHYIIIYSKSFMYPTMQRDTQGVHIQDWMLPGC